MRPSLYEILRMNDGPHFPEGSVARYVLYLQLFQFEILPSIWIRGQGSESYHRSVFYVSRRK